MPAHDLSLPTVYWNRHRGVTVGAARMSGSPELRECVGDRFNGLTIEHRADALLEFAVENGRGLIEDSLSGRSDLDERGTAVIRIGSTFAVAGGLDAIDHPAGAADGDSELRSDILDATAVVSGQKL